MKIQLTAMEARVIGCLLEKEATTPEQYPLTLNSLTNACNQKSNREPVMSVSEGDVISAVDALIAKRLVSDESSFNGRVAKYQHRFCNTEFGDLKFSAQEKAIICCLLLRGAQTPGELRTRTNRLCQFSDVREAEMVLDGLTADSAGLAIVVKLAREPGKRESRYMHQFCGEVDEQSIAKATSPYISSAESRIVQLEQEVNELRGELAALRQVVEAL